MFSHHFLNTWSLQERSSYDGYSNVVLFQCPYKLELFVRVVIKLFTAMKNYFLYSINSILQVFDETFVGIPLDL